MSDAASAPASAARLPATTGASSGTPVAAHDQRHTHVGPRSSWILDFREIWQFRELLWTLAARDLKVKYKQTVLGVVWVVLQPLATALVFTFVFGRILRIPFPGGVPPLLFIFGALTGFYLFRDIVIRSSMSLVGNRQLVAKIYFPRVLLPLATVLNALVDFAVALAVFAAIWLVMWITDDPADAVNVPGLGWNLLLWPAGVLLLVMIALGVGMAATAMSVSWRDVGHVIPVLLMLVMYASPVMYDISFVLNGDIEPWKQVAYFSNPLAGLIAGYRWSLIGDAAVSWPAFAYSAAMAVGLLLIGVTVFKRMERRFADVI